MADQSATAIGGNTPALRARLQPDAIGVTQDMVIGMAMSAPAGTACGPRRVRAASHPKAEVAGLPLP